MNVLNLFKSDPEPVTTDDKPAAEVEEAAASALGKNASFAKCDVTSEADVNTAHRCARSFHGGVHVGQIGRAHV